MWYAGHMKTNTFYVRQLRQRRVEAGLCPRCGRHPPAEAQRDCQPCIDDRHNKEAAMSPEAKEARRQRQRAYWFTNPDTKRRGKQRAYMNARLKVLLHYGFSCTCCQESNVAFLCIDHINGGGAEHRRQLGGSGGRINRWLVRNNFPPGFQVLCWNCNLAKSIHGQCPHTLRN